jgi:hypothetical protein
MFTEIIGQMEGIMAWQTIVDRKHDEFIVAIRQSTIAIKKLRSSLNVVINM